MTNPFDRNQKDASLVITKALPNNTNNTSDPFDLGQLATDSLPENLQVEISIPAIAGHTTTNDLTIDLLHSTTSTVTAATDPLIRLLVPGVAVTGSVAIVKRFRLPPNCKRYIAFKATATTDDCSAVTATYSLIF